MIRFSFIVLLAGILTVSCSEHVENKSIPGNLIPQDTMIMVIKDMTLLESYIQSKYLSVITYKKTMTSSGDSLLKRYHISRERYEQSMNYYLSQQLLMTEMYTQILDSLNQDASRIPADVARPKTQHKGLGFDENGVIPMNPH